MRESKQDTAANSKAQLSSTVQPKTADHQNQPLRGMITQAGKTPSAKAHAAMLNRAMVSQPHHRQNLLLQLQRQCGNSYVQRVINLSSQEKINRKQLGLFDKRTDKDWYAADMLHWAREIDNLANTKNTFVTAAIYNTKNNHPEEYTTIAQRSAYYDVIDALAEADILPKNVRFFGAASIVTGRNSVGSIEGLVGWSLHSKEAIQILEDVNKILFESNMRVINKLMSSGKPTDSTNPSSTEAISAIQFDLKMVEMEQGIVETYLQTQIDKIPQDKREEAIKDINNDLNFKGIVRTIGEKTLADTQALEWAKKALGVAELNFLEKKHRLAIGKAMVLSLHKNSLQEYLDFMATGTIPVDKLPEDYRGPFSMGIKPK